MYVSSRQGYKPPVKSTGKVKEYTHFASLKYFNGAETFYTYDPQRRKAGGHPYSSPDNSNGYDNAMIVRAVNWAKNDIG